MNAYVHMQKPCLNSQCGCVSRLQQFLKSLVCFGPAANVQLIRLNGNVCYCTDTSHPCMDQTLERAFACGHGEERAISEGLCVASPVWRLDIIGLSVCIVAYDMGIERLGRSLCLMRPWRRGRCLRHQVQGCSWSARLRLDDLSGL